MAHHVGLEPLGVCDPGLGVHPTQRGQPPVAHGDRPGEAVPARGGGRVAEDVVEDLRRDAAATSMFGQLSAGYRDGAFAEYGGGVGELRAGERVPDVGGLYDALDLSGLTLFVGDESDAAVEAGRTWEGVVTVREGFVQAPGTWLLVRPDGYLAAAGVEAVRLDRWLNRWFVKPAARAH